MKNRTVTHTLYADHVDMGGFPVRQAFPTNNVQQIDPFLLLHHAEVKVPKHTKPLHAGVGPHPHRGFSPVTFVIKGGVHHRDSRGNNSVVYAGGAQWMNAGRGMIHSERPPLDIHEQGGIQEIIQLWINLPAKNKMDQPSYFPILADEAGKYNSADGKIEIRVFAGNVLGAAGPVKTATLVNAAVIDAKAGSSITIPVPESFNAFLYLLSGKLMIDGYGLTEAYHAVVFDRNGDAVTFTAKEDSKILLMSAEPLEEEVVSHGPFVMNNQTQILEAMRDYQMGKMGILIEE